MPRLKPPSKEDSQLLPAFAALPDHAIYVPATPAEFAAARAALLAQTALGFDTESKPLFHVHQPDTGPHVVQLATPHAAWLLQLHLPQALELAREVIAHPHICKVGFGLDNDKSTLPRRLGVELAHIVDLDRVFKSYGYGASTGVRAAIALVLGQNFHKSKKQSTSNWSLPVLSDAQIRYAANDAHGPAMVYAALPAWEARQVAPSEGQHRHPARPDMPRTQRPSKVAMPRAPQQPAPRTEPTDTPRARKPAKAYLLRRPDSDEGN